MESSKPSKNPRTASEVTKEWLEVVLCQYESKTSPRSTVKVNSFEVNPGCGKGENFSSDVMRIVAEGLVTPAGGTPSRAHYSFIAKFLTGSEFEHTMAMEFGAPQKESLTLSEVLPTLNTFQEERGGDKYRINAPEYVYGVCKDGEYLLMMQDLMEAGFKVGDKRRGLSLSQLKIAVQNLAHLHSVSYAFNHTHDFLTKYPNFITNPLMTDIMGVFVRVLLEGIMDNFLKNREEEFPGVLKTLASNKDKLVSKVTDILSVSGKEAILCLCHGDYWTNNFMFKYDKEGDVEDFAMIDWGNVGWRNPVIDLLYVIHTSTQQDLRRDHLREVQKLYYDTFTSTAANLGAALPHWRFEDFLMEYQKSALMGVVFGLLVNLLTLSASAKKLSQGTLSTGFISWLRVKFAKVMMSIPNSWLIKMVYMGTKKAWKPYFEELASMNNPEMTTRVTNLITEAYQDGVLNI
ncbi:hypothetical protein O3P69_006124 [Scylla paramamosain]|uniref:CHK kinase-like domain-containing protein n=1 Tax=Scylla paramamosain TaxID=85552 RepID=A0AAW0U532_SCYPA